LIRLLVLVLVLVLVRNRLLFVNGRAKRMDEPPIAIQSLITHVLYVVRQQ
jgi:hypothetical protein